MTGFGPTGPYAQRPAYDGVGQAMGGMMSLLTAADDPTPIGPAFADNLSGMFGAYGILGALVARGRTGQGQMVGTSLVGAIVAFNVNAATTSFAGERGGRPHWPSPLITNLRLDRERRAAFRGPPVVTAQVLAGPDTRRRPAELQDDPGSAHASIGGRTTMS